MVRSVQLSDHASKLLVWLGLQVRRSHRMHLLDGQALIRNYIRPRSVSMILLPRHIVSNDSNMATGIHKKGFLERVQ